MVGVDLNIPSLIKEPSILIIIPILIVAFLISKLYLFLQYVLGLIKDNDIFSIFINIYAIFGYRSCKIAEQLKTITPEISGILILSAVITCVFVPMVFKKHSQCQKKQRDVLM